MSLLVRAALGQAASLGSLYDARTDAFVQFSAFQTIPVAAITRTDVPHTDSKCIYHDTFKDKFSSLGIGAQLGASFLGGLVTVEGSGRYLLGRRETNLVAQRSSLYNIQTVSEKLEFQNMDLESCLSWKMMELGVATHFVSEIIWGSRNIITVTQTLSSTDNSNNISGTINAPNSFWPSFKLFGGGEGAFNDTNQSIEESYDITVIGDVLANDGLVPTDLESANRFIGNLAKYVASSNEGKGKPLVYKLMPLSWLPGRLSPENSIPHIIENLETESFEKFVQVFDDLASLHQELNDYRTLLQRNRDFVSPDHIRAVGNRIVEVRNIETGLQANYARVLYDVRTGVADKVQLWKLLEDFESRNPKIHQLTDIISNNYKGKIRFLADLIAQGAKYIGFNGESLDLELGSIPDVDCHVLHFSEAAMAHSELWKQNLIILYQIVNNVTGQSRIILMDHDVFEYDLNVPRIEFVRNTKIIVSDVLEQRKISSSQSFVEYDDNYLERRQTKPLRRIPMKIPCPGKDCAPSPASDWICTRCGSIVEYGQIDDFLYCDCGRCKYKWWSFKCSNPKHGHDFHSYDESLLHYHLKDLEPFEELNILILGPTGVGKSTWINAFVNYLTYPTLDDALNADKLSWVIPFAFNTYDKQDDGEFKSIKVSFGFDEQFARVSTNRDINAEEHDGTNGESATQRVNVHQMYIENRLIRLIDTPGIGDTRGASQDKKNMADILGTLRMYRKLHGILILLKPNESRLDVMFRFCIQELLTHLHRDAAKNIAFGFTNTRGTGYTPGDTIDPLRKLLDQFSEVDIGIRQRNVFCFDSESFRYLAAQKQHNRHLGHLEETRASWKHSVGESQRLLDHFQSLQPHHVNSTVNLYETRRRINLMTTPMAEISQAITNTIMINQDLIDDLELKKLTKKELVQRLKKQVQILTLVPVHKPRTVCADKGCIKYESSGQIGSDGMPTLITVHKSFCHDPCYLSDVAVEKVGVPDLSNCAAMHKGKCVRCGHPWNMHLHIKYEYKNDVMEIDDPDIVADLERYASQHEKQEAVINSRKKYVNELEGELKTIRDAAAQFSVFLARNAITPFNDATLAYLDHQMEQERGKSRLGVAEINWTDSQNTGSNMNKRC